MYKSIGAEEVKEDVEEGGQGREEGGWNKSEER